MGENKNIEELDAFAKKYVKEISTDEPSSNFTSSIMDVILAEEKRTVYKNNTKLSYSIWFVLSVFIVAFVCLLLKGKSSKIVMPSLDFGELPSFNFSISTITIYAFFFLAILFAIQGFYMKQYFNKRLQ